MTFTGAIGAVCMFPLRAIIAMSVALGIHLVREEALAPVRSQGMALGQEDDGFSKPDTFAPVLPRNTVLPAERCEEFYTVADDQEAFYLRIAGPGQYRYPGADLGILVTRGRFMDDEHELLDRARTWITGIKSSFVSEPPSETTPPVRPEPFGFKML